MSHYFKNDRTLKEENIEITFDYQGKSFRFFSDAGVFSKKEIDYGSLILADYLCGMEMQGKLLDVGCGYGFLGIVCQSFHDDLDVTMLDINTTAVKLASKNCRINGAVCGVLHSDLYDKVSDTYDYIITNPPIRAGKKVVRAIMSGGLARLNDNGSFFMVIRKSQGAPSALVYLKELYGVAGIVKRKAGYQILWAEKQASAGYAGDESSI